MITPINNRFQTETALPEIDHKHVVKILLEIKGLNE